MSEPTEAKVELNPEPSFKVYKPSDTLPAPPPPPPDEYFTPTAADLREAQAQLTARSQALTNAPLQLRATREAAEKAKRDRWPNTTVRVRFTDGTQLEKVFPSTDKIRSVYAFVRESLKDDIKPIKFILYQPPRRELKVSDDKVRNLSLAELQLAPASVLLLKFLDDKLNGPQVPAPLQTSILQRAVDLPIPPSAESEVSPLSSSSKHSSGKSGEKKIPKWFKGLSKK